MNASLDSLVNSKLLENNRHNSVFLQQVINSLDECILVINTHQEILLMNKSFQNKLFLSGKNLGDYKKCTELFTSFTYNCHSNKNLCPFEEISRTQKAVRTIHHYSNDKDTSQYIELSITPLFDEKNNIYGYVECRRDISEHIHLNETLKEKETALYDLAHHDNLTGLPNRRLFLSHLEKVITKAKINQNMLAVLFIDLDNFKQINDNLGHQIGDEVLKITAQRLQRMVRKKDTVCRLGGDEFVILIESLKKPENAALLAQKIINNQSRKIKIKQHELFMRSSIGISLYPDNGLDAEALLQHADIAMYASKQLGRNTFSFYTQALTDNSLNRMLLEKDLNQAIEKKQLIIYYQPQVNLNSKQLTGMEAMIRWQHPSKGLLSPDKFIPIAEHSNLIEKIGEWVLTTVSKQIVAWQTAGQNPGRIAVNLAGRQLLDINLVKKIKSILTQTQCSAHSLEFKITEGFIPHLSDNSIQTLKTLRAMGIDLSIDDFGKGYASLAFLKRLPITRLKIDRSFIQNTTNESENADIAKAIIALGKSLHLKVMAEGVEKKNQQELLSRAGCKEAQGYLFGHPMNSDDMSLFLDNKMNKS